jgi:hypothetical protein
MKTLDNIIVDKCFTAREAGCCGADEFRRFGPGESGDVVEIASIP